MYDLHSNRKVGKVCNKKVQHTPCRKREIGGLPIRLPDERNRVSVRASSSCGEEPPPKNSSFCYSSFMPLRLPVRLPVCYPAVCP